MDDYKTWVDGYDVGIRYTDDALGQIVAYLKKEGIYEETAIIISSDHGENQGELNVYGDHQNADLITNRVPLIVKWPGVKPGNNDALCYQIDMAATVLDLLGQKVPERWDGKSFKKEWQNGESKGRHELVISQAAWTCQRAVIWDNYIAIKTYHDGMRDIPEWLLFDRLQDPHELNDLAASHPDIVTEGQTRLENWIKTELANSDYDEDPMAKTIEEGGPYHVRGVLEHFTKYYRENGKAHLADAMQEKYGNIRSYTEPVAE
jgi:choline-sulfatase